MGVAIFRNAVFEDQQIQQKTLEGFCDLLQTDRAGQLPSQVLSQNAVTLFHVLGVYLNIVEPRLLKLAQDYIMEWTETAVKAMTLADYARSSMALMESELNRCRTLGLDLSTRRDLEILLEHQIVERRQETLCKFLWHPRSCNSRMTRLNFWQFRYETKRLPEITRFQS